MTSNFHLYKTVAEKYPNHYIQTVKEFKDHYEILLMPLDEKHILPDTIIMDKKELGIFRYL